MWLYKIVTELEILDQIDDQTTDLMAWKLLETLYNKQGIDGWELVSVKIDDDPDADLKDAQIIAFFKKWEAD